MDSLHAAYEKVTYPSYPRAATTPDRLAAVALLFGLTPPHPEGASVLELGCSDAGNLIAMAVNTTGAQFLGIDVTASAIARGQEQIRDLNLKNIRLRELDLMNFPDDAGTFDYIIAHGVFSWVPAEVRTRVFGILQRHLSPNGVAYIDYNAQPGGQLRYAFRESMRFHTQRFTEPQQRIEQARSLIKLVIDANPQPNVYRRLAEEELERLLRTPDSALFHDSLSAENTSFYFHQFIAAAGEHRIQYLAEADVSEMSDSQLPAPVRERLGGLRGIIDKEQYLDILKNRVFRQTLLCHQGMAIHRVLDESKLTSLYFSSNAAAIRETDGTVFRTPRGSVKTTNLLVIAVMSVLLAKAPGRYSLEELMGKMQRSAEAGSGAEIAEILVHAVMSGVITIHSRRAPFTSEIAERPVASALARWQAERRETIASLAHEIFYPADEMDNQVVALLDGTHSIAEIAETVKIDAGALRERLERLASHALFTIPA